VPPCQVTQRRLRRPRKWLVVVRRVLPALRSIHPRLREAAALLGASPWRGMARGRLAHRRADGARGGRVRLHRLDERVQRDEPDRPARVPDHADRHLPLPGPSRRGQLWPGAGDVDTLMLVCTLGFLAIERFRLGEVGKF
jgi:thiamine transport system permease protein